MRALDFSRFTLGACVSAALLARCSSGAQSPALSPTGFDPVTQRQRAGNGVARDDTSKSWMTPAARRGKNLVYVSDQNTVEIYPAGKTNPAPIGAITEGLKGPDGLSVDTNGDLYVTNAGSNFVTVYRAGHTKPYFTYSPGNDPHAVVVGRDGTVYIAQGQLGCVCITEYARGSYTPLRTIPLSSTGGQPMEMALDRLGNLYVSLTDNVYGGDFNGVYKFAPGQTTGNNIGLLGLHHARGLAFDRQQALLVGDDPLDFRGGYIDIYPPGKTQYSKQIAVGPQPFEIAFGRGQSQLYVTIAGYYYYYGGYIRILDVRDKFKRTGTVSQGLHSPLGVALSPDAK